MIRKRVVKWATTLLAAFIAVVAAQAADKKPNVIMLMTDDAGWADFGYISGGGATLGHPTPNIDRIAKLPNMKLDAERGLTLYIQKESPGADKESNWLPAPNGPIYLVMRLYWPNTEQPSILPPGEGTWKPPGIVRAD